MKKFFTLIAVALMAVSANAKESIDPFTAWNEGILDGNTYTFNGSWQGAATYLGNADYSAYDYVWVKYSGFTGKINLAIVYNEWLNPDWGGTFDQEAEGFVGASGVLGVKLNKTKTYIKGNAETDGEFIGDIYALHVRQIQIQDQGEASTLTVEGIFVGTAAEFAADGGVIPEPEPERATFNAIWGGDCSDAVNGQFIAKEWRTSEEVYMGPADISEGFAKVYVRSKEQAEAAGNPTLQDGNYADYDSQFFVEWEERYALQAGDKIQLKMKVKADVNATIGTQCHASAGNYIHWYAVGDINFTTEWAPFESQEIVAMAKKSDGGFDWGKAAEGTHCIALNLAKGIENTFYFDDIEVWLTLPTTGITKVFKVQPTDNNTYNLAGQRVDANYKGVVIKNGRKFVNK